MNKGRCAVLISGRGSHLKNLLDCCKRGEIAADISLVISNKSDAPGLQYPREAGIESVILPHKQFPSREEYDAEIVRVLKEHRIDLICLAGFMRLLSPIFIRAFPLKIMNVHPAVLPAFPGLHAQKQAIEYGVKITGVTVHFVDEGLDSGPIIVQKTLEVFPEDTEETLSARLLPVEHQAYAEAVRLFFEDRLRVNGRTVKIKD
jgi:phosphoribosylglycinamide formyltransferase 1